MWLFLYGWTSVVCALHTIWCLVSIHWMNKCFVGEWLCFPRCWVEFITRFKTHHHASISTSHFSWHLSVHAHFSHMYINVIKYVNTLERQTILLCVLWCKFTKYFATKPILLCFLLLLYSYNLPGLPYLYFT